MGKNRNGRRKKAQQSNTPSTDGEDQALDGSLLIDIDPPLPPPQLSSKLLAAHADPVHDLEEDFYASGNDYSDELWTGEEQKERGVDDELLSDSAHIREPIFTQPLEHPAQGPEPTFEHERVTFDNRTGSGRTDDVIANPSQDVVRFSNGSENTDEDTRAARAAANVSKGRTGTAGSQPESVLPGHTRAPMISRNPTRLENLSKTVTNYVPSSIAISIPSAALSPPRVSRPVSFGRFMTSSDQDDRSIPADQHRRSWGPEAGFKTLDEVLALDEPDTTTASINMRYPKPGVEGTERITWARWDALPDSEGSRPRLILLLGYMSGMQIWDCTNLDALKELLNFPDVPWGRIWQAAVLPPRLDDGELDSVRPLLGIISKQASRDPEFLVYSIRSHTILKRISVPGLVSFAASSRFIILSCANPSALNILSASTFTILHIIPSSSLALFGRRRPQSPTHPPNERRDDTHEPEEVIDPEALPSEYDMRPVFALSGRLLAATSPPPREDYPATTRTNSGYLGMDPANLPGADVVAGLTQSDLGTAARRVGSSMLSGVRALGGLAISAARTHFSGDSSSPISAAVRPRPVATSPSPTPPLRPFASRSAPSPTGLRLGATADNVQPLLTDLNPTSSDRATYVTVYDLMPLLDGDQSLEPFSHTIQSQPQTHSLSRQASHSSTMILNPVTSFPSPRNIRVSALQFSSDGTRVLVVPEDGHTLREYAIRPPLCVNGRYTSEESDDDVARAKGNHSWHVYDLRRGRTTAVVDSVEPSADGRWIALGSRKRTVHVFATNPYGGPSDERSHMAGRVFNASALQPLSTTLTPIIRLRAPHVDPGGLSPPPLAVTFISAPLNSLPRRLLPPANVHSPPSSTTGSAASSPSPEPRSPIARKRPTNYQDVLIFDSLDGTLSLRRFFLEQRQTELGLAVPNGIPGIGGTSISLPSRPSFGLSSSSPSSGRVSALSAMMEKPAELHARESEIATWNLRRSREWDVFRGQVHNAPISKAIEQKGKTNWLWQAELQTSSLSRQILPRSIYLVYQFAFFTLDEDYQGVIRRQRLDVAGSRTPVRREVPVSAHAVGDGDAPFTQRAGRASFDEGLSSAISSSLDVGAGSPPVIPTYPNGGTSGSYKSSMPISRVTEGMSEGLARMRREIGRVRSPRILPRVDKDAPASAGVPLEFDEADEHFALEGGMSSPSASQEASDDCDRLLGHFSQDNRLQGAQAAQHTNLPLDNEQEDFGARYAGSSGVTGGSEVARAEGTTLGDHDSEIWPSWEHAVGEAEPFDEISAVGFMDEEQEAQQEAERELARATTGGSGKKKRRRRGKSPTA